jgi:hypothetical protein
MAEQTSLPIAPTQTVTAPSPMSYDRHVAPSFDVLDLLPPAAADKYRALRQRSADAHAVVPSGEDVRQANIAKVEAANNLARLTAHPQDFGFNLRPDDRRVIVAQKLVDKLALDAKRLTELQEVRAAAWRSASSALAAVEDWLKGGRPGCCALEAVEAPDVKLLKGETILDAIERLRRRGRELKADIARLGACPFPSSYVRAKIKQEVEALAMRGQPIVSDVIEHDRRLIWPVVRVQAQVLNVQAGAIAFAEVPDTLALTCGLHKDALIAKLDAEIAAESDAAAALTHEARQQREAETLGDLLSCERDESWLVWRAQSEGMPCEHRSDINPVALLGIALVTAPHATNGHAAPSSVEHAVDYLLAGR